MFSRSWTPIHGCTPEKHALKGSNPPCTCDDGGGNLQPTQVLSDSDRASYVWSEESGALNGLTVEKRLTDENSPSLVLDSLALSPGAWSTIM
eukprot:1379181-Amorphochlora_amoeboformis.AAC.1